MVVLSRLSRPTLNLSKRYGGGFSYLMSRSPKNLIHLTWAKEMGCLAQGLLFALGLGYGFSAMFGNAEGPYLYDPDEFTPEEWETKSFALDRFLFKYILPATSVAHWQTYAGYTYETEMANKNRLILDVRRISSQIGATGTWQGMMTPGLNAGGLHDKNNTAHTLSPQLLNEMIQYADENDIKRTRDMVIRKVITDNDNEAWRSGVLVQFGGPETNGVYPKTMKIPAHGVAPYPPQNPGYYEDPKE